EGQECGLGHRRGPRLLGAELLPQLGDPGRAVRARAVDLRAAVPVHPVHRQRGPALADRQAHQVVLHRHGGRSPVFRGRDHRGELDPSRGHPYSAVRALRGGPDTLDLVRNACNLSRMRNLSHPRNRVFLLAATAGLAIGLPACAKKRGKGHATSGGDSAVVAKVDDEVITVADVQERINKQSPFVRARYTSNEKKKEFLDSLIRFEVMANEAKRRGYDEDPEVLRVMKQQMISKFLQKDCESKLKVEDVPDAEVEKYFKEHPAEFNQKDEVRVGEVVAKDKAKADKAYAEARALPKTAAAPGTQEQKQFKDVVTKYSEDEDAKQRGGDLGFF